MQSAKSVPVSLTVAPVAQLDRAPGYEPGGREFESLRAHHSSIEPSQTANELRYATEHRRASALHPYNVVHAI